MYRLFCIVFLLALPMLLGACQSNVRDTGAKHLAPVSKPLKEKMSQLNMAENAPILVRIFKEESELEVWKQTRQGRYNKLKTYDICRWSGELGPKRKEGDRQAPEGFYQIRKGQMNRYSNFHLAFNVGYPNRYDRSHQRTGAHLMVHGACSSRGCYAMTDPQIEEIYALARDAFAGGNEHFQLQAFPFRMTPSNMVRHRDHQDFAFWQNIKTGYDHFELTRRPPNTGVCNGRYTFDRGNGEETTRFDCQAYASDPHLQQLVKARGKRDEQEFNVMVAGIEARRKLQENTAKTLSMLTAFLNPASSQTGIFVEESGNKTGVEKTTELALVTPALRPKNEEMVAKSGESAGNLSPLAIPRFISRFFGGEKSGG